MSRSFAVLTISSHGTQVRRELRIERLALISDSAMEALARVFFLEQIKPKKT